jgi:hypothetical protein
MANLSAIYKISADISGLQSNVSKGVQAMENMESTAGRLGKAIVGAFSVHQVIQGAGQMVQAFGEEEAAAKKLETALRAQGSFTPELAQHYRDLAAEFQNTTVFADDLVMEMEGLLVQVGNVAPEQMKAALTAATNLAAGLGIDLRTATMLVGKAFEGETGTLGRYGIVLDETKKKADPVGATLDAIHAKFGGQAQAQIETYQGKMARAGNVMNDAQESAGGLIAKGLTPLLDLFGKLPQPIQSTLSIVHALTPNLEQLALGLIAIGGPGKAIALVSGAFSALTGFFTSTLLPMLSTALPIALRALAVLLTPPAGLVIAGILAVVAIWRNWDTIKDIVIRVYNAVKEWLVDKFVAIVQSVKDKINAVTGFFADMYDKVVGHSYVPDMIKGVQREFGKLQSVMVEPTLAAISKVVSAFGSIEGVVKTVGKSIEGLKSGFDKMTSGGGLSSILSGFTGIMGGIGGIVSAAQAAISIGKTLFGLFDRDKGRDLVEDFVKQFGGFDGIQKIFAEMGDEGHRLWVMLTQGVGRNNPDQARRAIEEVTEAIRRYREAVGSGLPAPNYPEPPSFTPPENSFANGSDGIRDFGSGTLAMLHGREAVVTESQLGRMSGPSQIVIPVSVGGRTIETIVVDVLTHAVQRRQLVGAV